jgi:hypothetical protein
MPSREAVREVVEVFMSRSGWESVGTTKAMCKPAGLHRASGALQSSYQQNAPSGRFIPSTYKSRVSVVFPFVSRARRQFIGRPASLSDTQGALHAN